MLRFSSLLENKFKLNQHMNLQSCKGTWLQLINSHRQNFFKKQFATIND